MRNFCKDSVGKVIVAPGRRERALDRYARYRHSRPREPRLKQQQKIDNKQELMIFVTPKIVREGVNVTETVGNRSDHSFR